MRIGRLLIAALAVAAIAWFVVLARDARDLTEATALAGANTVSARRAADARAQLSAASTLNPDREVTLVRAAVAADRNQIPRAQRLIQQVTRAEPENLVAWDLLAQISGSDSRLEATALAHVAVLHPRVHGRS